MITISITMQPLRSLWLTAALCALLPLVNALTTARGLPGSLLQGDGVFVWFDVAMLAISALLQHC